MTNRIDNWLRALEACKADKGKALPLLPTLNSTDEINAFLAFREEELALPDGPATDAAIAAAVRDHLEEGGGHLYAPLADRIDQGERQLLYLARNGDRALLFPSRFVDRPRVIHEDGKGWAGYRRGDLPRDCPLRHLTPEELFSHGRDDLVVVGEMDRVGADGWKLKAWYSVQAALALTQSWTLAKK